MRYPLVEAATGLAFALAVGAAYLGMYPFAVLPAVLYWAAVGIALTLIDLDHHRLPNAIVLPSWTIRPSPISRPGLAGARNRTDRSIVAQ